MSNIAQLGFEHLNPKFKIDKPVRLIELFAGIGSQAKALQNLGVDFEKWVISEWEVNATKSYKAIHCENDNTDYSKGLNQKELINALFGMGISNDGKEPMTLKQVARKNEKWLKNTYNAYKATHNISNLMLASGRDLNIVDVVNYIYILTYSFPCQDLSIAGKQAGMKKGSKTRSGLLWEVERLLKESENLPQVLIMENVTQVHNKKNFADFQKWIECLEDLGYSNYYADLNAKNYGVPQNRNRCFMVSLLGNYSYTFPLPITLTKRLKDILEADVDEKYYLSSTVLDGFKKHNERHNAKGTGFLWKPKTSEEIACCIRANSALAPTDNTIIEEGDSLDIAYPNSTTRRGRHIKGMSHTITSENNSQVVVVDDTYKSREKRKYDDVCPALRSSRSGFKVQTEPIIFDDYNSRIPKEQNVIGTITTNIGNSAKGNAIKIIEPDYSLVNFKIRRLTSKECLRLMTFEDDDYKKIKAAGISDSSIYKQAGNSIVVKVLMAIFKELI